MGFKKRFLTITAALALALSVSISAAAQTGCVIADSLNVRSSNNTASEVITKVSNGTELQILASVRIAVVSKADVQPVLFHERL